jgi:hypothetical protein
MKISLVVATALLFAATPAFSELSEQEMIGLINRVSLRINGGEINALNDLTTLPGNVAEPVLLDIFKHNYNVFQATPLNRSIGTKAAQLVTTTPGGEEYLVKLLKDAREGQSNNIYFQQVSAVNCLALVKNKLAVRVLCGALADSEIGGRAADALVTMSLPDAPYSPKSKPAPKKAEAVAKWKTWWDAHKGNYSD